MNRAYHQNEAAAWLRLLQISTNRTYIKGMARLLIQTGRSFPRPMIP